MKPAAALDQGSITVVVLVNIDQPVPGFKTPIFKITLGRAVIGNDNRLAARLHKAQCSRNMSDR